MIVGLVVGAVLLAGGNDAEPVDSSETETSDTTGADGEETEEPVDGSAADTAAAISIWSSRKVYAIIAISS